MRTLRHGAKAGGHDNFSPLQRRQTEEYGRVRCSIKHSMRPHVYFRASPHTARLRLSIETMSIEGYADFLVRMGHRIVRIGSTTWFDTNPRIFSPLPFHAEVDPSAMDWGALFRQNCLAARCCVPTPWGRPSYRLMVDDPTYDFAHLASKARNQTRRGLESCTVREITFDELSTHGTSLERDTLIRQNRRIPGSLEQYWRRYFAHAAKAQGAIAWGAFHQNSLAAYLIAFEMTETVHILIVRSATAHLRFYPNNALLFRFVSETLRTGRAREISIGLESIQTGLGPLDHFKEGLGFRKLPTRQYVTLAPLLRMALRGPVLRASAACLDLATESQLARKAAGLLRWYDNQLNDKAAQRGA